MRRSSWLTPSLLAVALVVHGPALHAQQARAARASRPIAAPVRSDSGYSSRESDFVVGRKVYLHSTKTLIGTITDADGDHKFPADRFPRARMKAVLIERLDGPRSWTPVEGITRIYVAR